MICGGLSSNKLALMNAVFVNPGDSGRFGLGANKRVFAEIKVNSVEHVVYEVFEDQEVVKGELGLNGIQRAALKLSQGLPLELRSWTLNDRKTMPLFSIRMELGLLGKNKESFDEQDLQKFIFQRFPDFMFAKHQNLVVDYLAKKVVLKVLEVKQLSSELVSQDRLSSISENIPKDRGFLIPDNTSIEIEADSKNRLLELKRSKMARKNIIGPNFKFSDLGIGGLDEEFAGIFRRAFASRAFPAEVIQALGINHVRGMLLYGPPGTGKTLIARQIGKMLHGREPKIVNGPEILSKYVGESEKNIRELFADAEADYKENGEHSDLHIIIFDEIDAICKQRGSHNDGTGVHDTVVNQLLSKIDGVNSLNNILVIGMTNRKDMIDEALLRPGRLEVHVQIGLPDEAGRFDIFMIHTKKMRENKTIGPDVDLRELASLSKNYSGAEIAGVVKSAASFALNSNVDFLNSEKLGIKNIDSIQVNREHFLSALNEVKPAFGVEEEALLKYIRGGVVSYGPVFENLIATCEQFIQQVKSSDRTPLLSVLLEGESGTGKTALAAHLAVNSGFPFVKMLTPEDMVGFSESSKCQKISKVFDDAYKSPLSLIVLDNIERLLDYVRIGPRFANPVLQTLLILIKKIPPNPTSRLLILGTTSDPHLLEDLSLREAFQVTTVVPQIVQENAVQTILRESNINMSDSDIKRVALTCSEVPIGIKKLLLVIEMASQSEDEIVSYEKFVECLKNYGM